METPPQSSSVALQNTENGGNGISIPTMEQPLDAAQPNQSESLKESEHTSSAREDVPKVSAQPLEPAISSTDAGATQPLDRSPDAAVAMGAISLPFRVKDHPNGGNGADKKPTGDPPRNALGQLSGAVGISNGAPDEPHEMRPVERESSINAGMEAQQLALPAEVEDEFVSDTNERENEALRSAMSVRDHTTVDSLEDNNVVLNATGVEGRALTVGPGGEGAVLSAGSDAEKDPNALQENLEGGICANNKNDPERPILFDRSAVQIKKVPSTERVEMKRQWHQLISQDTRTPQTIHEEGTCPSMLSIGDETVMETQQGGNGSVHAIHVLEKRDGADKASVVPGGVEATKNHVSEELLYVTQITDMVRNLSKAEPEIFVEQQRGEHTRVEPVSQETTPRDLVGVRHLPECIDDEVLEEGAYSVAESTDEELGNIGTDMPSDSVSSGRKLMLGGDCSVLVHGTDKSHVSDAAMLAVRKSEEKEDPTTQNLPQGKESTQKHNDHGQSTTEISRKSEFDMIDDAVEKEAFVQVADWRSSDMRNSSSHANSSSAAIRQHKELRTLQSRIPEQMKCSQLVTDPGIASIIPRQSSEHGQRKGAETTQEIIAEENMDIYGFRSFRHGCAVAQETPVTGGDPPETEGTSSAQVFASKDVLNEENDTQKEHAAASSIVRADEDENHAACDEGHQAVEKGEENLCPSTNGTEHSVCSDGAGALQQASGIVGTGMAIRYPTIIIYRRLWVLHRTKEQKEWLKEKFLGIFKVLREN